MWRCVRCGVSGVGGVWCGRCLVWEVSGVEVCPAWGVWCGVSGVEVCPVGGVWCGGVSDVGCLVWGPVWCVCVAWRTMQIHEQTHAAYNEAEGRCC